MGNRAGFVSDERPVRQVELSVGIPQIVSMSQVASQHPPRNPDHRDIRQIRHVPDNRYRLPDFLTDKTSRSAPWCGCGTGELPGSVVSQG